MIHAIMQLLTYLTLQFCNSYALTIHIPPHIYRTYRTIGSRTHPGTPFVLPLCLFLLNSPFPFHAYLTSHPSLLFHNPPLFTTLSFYLILIALFNFSMLILFISPLHCLPLLHIYIYIWIVFVLPLLLYLFMRLDHLHFIFCI